MNCPPPQELSAYLDGELAVDRTAAIREHLGRCAACRDEIARLEAVSDALDSLEGAEPNAYFAPRLRRLAAGRRTGGWPRRLLVPAAATAAAALSLLLGSFLGRALYAEPEAATPNGDGALASYLGVAPVEDFPDGSLGEAWGDVWPEGDAE
jgi:anti-sigma factor RsiW